MSPQSSLDSIKYPLSDRTAYQLNTNALKTPIYDTYAMQASKRKNIAMIDPELYAEAKDLPKDYAKSFVSDLSDQTSLRNYLAQSLRWPEHYECHATQWIDEE